MAVIASNDHCDAVIAGLVGVIVVLLMICVQLGRQLCKTRRHQMPDGIYLQIAVRHVTETIHLGECSMPLDHVYQSKATDPLLRDLKIGAVWGGYVAHMIWGRALYTTDLRSGERAVTMRLPEDITVSRDLNWALQDGRGTMAMARLLRYTGGLATTVPKGMPMISAAGWSAIGVRHARPTNKVEASRGGRVPGAATRPVPMPRREREPRATGSTTAALEYVDETESLSEIYEDLTR